MKESHSEGLATHTGPESCGGAREGVVKRAGRVLSRERSLLRERRRGGEMSEGRTGGLDIARRYRLLAVTDPVKPRFQSACARWHRKGKQSERSATTSAATISASSVGDATISSAAGTV
jgi:hypothetical protein